MHNEIGPVVLGFLSAVFAAYGTRELAFAYRTPKLQEWGERAVPAAGSVLLAGLFADMTLQNSRLTQIVALSSLRRRSIVAQIHSSFLSRTVH